MPETEVRYRSAPTLSGTQGTRFRLGCRRVCTMDTGRRQEGEAGLIPGYRTVERGPSDGKLSLDLGNLDVYSSSPRSRPVSRPGVLFASVPLAIFVKMSSSF